MAEKKIGERFFKTEPLLATKGLLLQARLFKALGPAVGRFAAVMHGYREGATPEDVAMAQTHALVAISDIFVKAEPIQIADLISDIASVAMIRRNSGSWDPVDFDGDFTGRAQDIMPVVAFVLVEQFGDFFTGLLGVGSLAKAVKKA